MEYDQSHKEKEAIDQERWRQGTTSYARFYNTLTPDQRTELHKPPDTVQWRKNPGDLQAMFLGEKAMVFEEYGEGVNGKLARAGYGIAGPYAYDRDRVRELLERHPNICAEFSTSDPDVFMRAFAEKPRTEYHELRGLLVGYPASAVQYFVDSHDSTEALISVFNKLYADSESSPNPHVKNMLEDFQMKHGKDVDYWGFQFLRDHLASIAGEVGMPMEEVCHWQQEAAAFLAKHKRYGAYGVYWRDARGSPESEVRERRLKKAFERSGILRVDKRERVNRGMRSVASVISKRFRRLLGRPQEENH